MTTEKRNTRKRVPKKLDLENWSYSGFDDDELGINSKCYYLIEKLTDPKFESNQFVTEVNGRDLDLNYFKTNGFKVPLLCKDKTGLDLTVPDSETFSIDDVRKNVGSNRNIDVIEVGSHTNFEMTLKEFQRYYENDERNVLLNVISLEFSHTKLDKLVESPRIVRELDWVDIAWPKCLRSMQKCSTNVLADMHYPKVKKYALMSVKNCYTDFHVDFGGSSVWYHILKGEKVFWLVPPTEENHKLFKNWVSSSKQNYKFFGDLVKNCQRVTIRSGSTVFLPSGWIHAVFTPQDSIVFGGNFLNSFSIKTQIDVAKMEDIIHVNNKFRFPFFMELHWYVLEKYVYHCFGKSFLNLDKVTADEFTKDSSSLVCEKRKIVCPRHGDCDMTEPNIFKFINSDVIDGIRSIVNYLSDKPLKKCGVPDYITDAVSLINCGKSLIDRFAETRIADDSSDLIERNSNSNVERRSVNKTKSKLLNVFKPAAERRDKKKRKIKDSSQKRRVRCKKCENCLRKDCGSCSCCLDMKKFGGKGSMKQACRLRLCPYLTLPKKSFCVFCNGSKSVVIDSLKETVLSNVDEAVNDRNSLVKNFDEVIRPDCLMQCHICDRVMHPFCFAFKHPEILIKSFSSYVNESLPDSWECPGLHDGRNLKSQDVEKIKEPSPSGKNEEDKGNNEVCEASAKPDSVLNSDYFLMDVDINLNVFSNNNNNCDNINDNNNNNIDGYIVLNGELAQVVENFSAHDVKNIGFMIDTKSLNFVENDEEDVHSSCA